MDLVLKKYEMLSILRGTLVDSYCNNRQAGLAVKISVQVGEYILDILHTYHMFAAGKI